MNNPPIILSVSELTHAIKSHLEPAFRHIWVRGEISNYRLQASGHMYFTLGDGNAQLPAALFRSAALTLERPIKNGDTVIAEGEISVYPPKGNYQLIVRKVTHAGLGEALLKLQALKKKLHGLGWFSPERKRPLPANIQTICLVTSPSGAVLHDVITTLTRRLGGFRLVINPVKVQGEGAADQIARAIAECNAHALGDVIIVCRGGGSAEDLSPFNEESVAAACLQSTIPIISAIGHETDLSITDLVADLRAPTPTAAAELVSHEGFERRQRLSAMTTTLHRTISKQLLFTTEAIRLFAKRLDQSTPQRAVELHSRQLDDAEDTFQATIDRYINTKKNLLNQAVKRLIHLSPTTRLAEQQSKVVALEKAISGIVPAIIQRKMNGFLHSAQLVDERMKRRFSSAQQRYVARNWPRELAAAAQRTVNSLRQKTQSVEACLTALNPQRTLERGYAIVFRGNSTQVVRSVSMVAPHDNVTIRVADGTIEAAVENTHRKDTSHG